MGYLSIIILLIFFFGWVIFIFFYTRYIFNQTRNSLLDRAHINENSYQKYAKFYGEYVPTDHSFDQKLNMIYDLIVNRNNTDIRKMAETSHCSLTECILKIRYLKNKRMIGDYYIDTINMLLLPCSSEDQKLLDQYKPFIYGSHLQIQEIANVMNNPGYLTIQELRDMVSKDIQYLYDKGLLNGIKIDPIDKTIIYYTIEKKKAMSDKESVHCPNCGALNDVDIFGKVRCGYCQGIIRGKNNYDEGI